MTTELTYAQAKEAVAAAVTEQDTIRENLLDLDRSFGKRLLAGASLTGESKRRWDGASADLAALWQLFAEYSAVVDRAAEMTGRIRKPGARLEEIAELLSGSSVRLAASATPRSRRDLTAGGDAHLTLAQAVGEMKRAYAEVADVVNAAETVWSEAADQLQQASTRLDEAAGQTEGFEDEDLKLAVQAAQQDLADLRELMNADPLALWQGGGMDGARFDHLRKQTAVVTLRVAELSQVREDATARIAAVTAAVAAAQNARQDAETARQRSAVKIAVEKLPELPDVAGLTDRLATLDKLQTGGRWTRLLSEIDVIEEQAAAAAQRCREAEREAASLLDRRDELRGLLDAYRARAAQIGGAENPELDTLHERARDLLWTAPCDLPAAADAVTSFQQAVLALAQQGRRP
jgi:hypothetical protein